MFFAKKNIPVLAIFLVPVFFTWHVVNAYFGLIPAHYIAKYLFLYLLLALVLFLIGWLVTKNIIKAVCWATALLVIFFFWGAFEDFMKKLPVSPFFSSNRFLLSLVAVFILSWSFILRRRKTPLTRLSRFFAILFGVFVLVEAVTSCYKLVTRQAAKNSLTYYNVPIKVGHFGSFTGEPDIFFIVFDEYASSRSLKNYLGFNNELLDSSLSHHKFFTAYGSKGNYNATPYSLASTFGLDYFNIPLANSYTEAKDRLRAQYTLKKSLLPVLLKDFGYNIKNLGLFDLDGAPGPFEPLFEHDAREALYDETMWARLSSEIGWMFTRKKNNTPRQTDLQEYLPIEMNIRNIDSIYKEMATQGPVPKFVLGHVLVPHDPYYYRKDGSLRTVSPNDENPSIRDSLYLDQLQYINHWIDSLTVLADRPFARPRVVIIEGDHGRRDDTRAYIHYAYNKQFMNLNTYYFSDHDYSMLYDSISPVNSFRVVLNKYFQFHLPLLKDSTILVH